MDHPLRMIGPMRIGIAAAVVRMLHAHLC